MKTDGVNLPYVDTQTRECFIHSFYALIDEEVPFVSSTYCDIEICSAFEKNGNIFGVQFHPEKSQKPGSIVINNFLNL